MRTTSPESNDGGTDGNSAGAFARDRFPDQSVTTSSAPSTRSTFRTARAWSHILARLQLSLRRLLSVTSEPSVFRHPTAHSHTRSLIRHLSGEPIVGVIASWGFDAEGASDRPERPPTSHRVDCRQDSLRRISHGWGVATSPWLRALVPVASHLESCRRFKGFASDVPRDFRRCGRPWFFVEYASQVVLPMIYPSH